jgi:hypothetical protein
MEVEEEEEEDEDDEKDDMPEFVRTATSATSPIAKTHLLPLTLNLWFTFTFPLRPSASHFSGRKEVEGVVPQQGIYRSTSLRSPLESMRFVCPFEARTASVMRVEGCREMCFRERRRVRCFIEGEGRGICVPGCGVLQIWDW